MDTVNDAPQFRKFPVAKINSSRSQARKDFPLAGIQSLAQTMQEDGLDNPVHVRLLPDGSAELVAGERRVRAARLLGWTEIDAKVYPALSDQDAAMKGLIENLQREDLNPMDEARGFKVLTEHPYGLNQEAIAQRTGKDQTTIARALSLLSLPDDLQDFMTRVIKGEGHTRHLKKIQDVERRKALTAQAEKEGWSVKETEKRVNAALGKVASPPAPLPKGEGGAEAKRSATGEATTAPDPLAEFWPQAQVLSKVSVTGQWHVQYKEEAWQFTYKPLASQTPKSDIGRWFRSMSDILLGSANGGYQGSSSTFTPTQEEQAEKDRHLRFAPTTREDTSRVMQEMTKARIPQTQEEEAKLLAIARASSGPAELYEQILGPGNFYSERFKGVSWQEAGYQDADAGYRQTLSSFRTAAEFSKAKSAPPAAPVSKARTIDPEVQAMIDRVKARRGAL